VLEGLIDAGTHAVRLYRIARRLEMRAARWSRWLSYILYRLNVTLTGADIPPTVSIGANFRIPHPVGVVFGGGAVIGDNVKVMSGVVLGSKHAHWSYSDEAYPVIEDGVFVGANAVVLGPIRVGKGSVIGACAVVTTSVPPHTVVRAPEPVVEPSRVAPREERVAAP